MPTKNLFKRIHRAFRRALNLDQARIAFLLDDIKEMKRSVNEWKNLAKMYDEFGDADGAARCHRYADDASAKVSKWIEELGELTL